MTKNMVASRLKLKGRDAGLLPSFLFTVLVVGAGGIIAQTVLLREFLVTFSGNELTVGVIIGSWVLWEALGAFVAGRRPFQGPRQAGYFAAALILFSVLFPPSIYLVRLFKPLAGIPPEVGVGIPAVLLSALALLLPAALLHGFLFTLSCTVHDLLSARRVFSIGSIYFVEMAGTVAGGLVVTFLLVPLFTSFQIALGVAFVSCTSCLLMARRRESLISLPLTVSLGLVALATLAAVAGPWADRLQKASIAGQWGGREVVSYTNSPYQNIAVVRQEGQHTFFTDGLPTLTAPDPDIAFVEEFVHLPLLAIADPRSVLVIEGGVGGIIAEILKYPSVERVDYVEIDPCLLRDIRRFAGPLAGAELADRRVTVHVTDGRRFLLKPPALYDAILIGVRAPTSLQANRFFTGQFFRLAGRALKQGGILALTSPGSLSYYGRELKDVNASIERTLLEAFPSLVIIPGDYNLFLASTGLPSDGVSFGSLSRSLEKGGLVTRLITPPHLAYRLDREKRQWLLEQLGTAKARSNSDFLPSGLFYNLALENALFSPSLKGLFRTMEAITLSWVIAGIVLAAALLGLAARRRPRAVIPWVIGTTGFTAMVAELLLIFAFQVSYGHLYQIIGILISAFMAGLALGGLAMTRMLPRFTASIALLMTPEGLLLFLSLAGLLILPGLSPAPEAVSGGVIIGLLVVFGFLTGAEFPLASALYHTTAGDKGVVGTTVGVIYGADLLGGWLGGLIGALVLFPVLGLTGTVLILAVLKLSSLGLLVLSRRK